MKNQNKLKVIIPVLLISSSIFVLFQSKTDNSLNRDTNLDSQNSDSIDSTDKTAVSIDLQKLSILENRCRGCGRCAQIDPSHFEMNGNTAIVISSTNLDSSNLKLAINNCHDQAIILE